MTGIGERLKILRAKTSQGDFAARFGVHRNTLARWEAGEREPDVTFLVQLSGQEKIAHKWLLTGVGPMFENMQSVSSDSEKHVRQSDMLKNIIPKHSDIIDVKKNAPYDRSDVSDTQQEISSLNRELRDLLRENGDLRVDIERKNARIAELERELVRVLKGEEPTGLASAG